MSHESRKETGVGGYQRGGREMRREGAEEGGGEVGRESIKTHFI